MKQYKETGKTTNKLIPGRKHSVQTKRVVEIVRKRVQRNPRRSVRALKNFTEKNCQTGSQTESTKNAATSKKKRPDGENDAAGDPERPGLV